MNINLLKVTGVQNLLYATQRDDYEILQGRNFALVENNSSEVYLCGIYPHR